MGLTGDQLLSASGWELGLLTRTSMVSRSLTSEFEKGGDV